MSGDWLRTKFHVERLDGRDQPGGDKADARYFVLDYVHDPHARTALAAYADACEAGLPGLAADLRAALGVPVPDMSTDPASSVGAHNEAHSAHTPAAPEEAEPPCGLPRGLCGDDEDCRLPPCRQAPAVPEEEKA